MKEIEQIAVITGDIVNSSILKEEDKKVIQSEIENFSHDGIFLRPRFYRGDSFQLATKPEDALLLALKFRMGIRRQNEASDLRAAIGIGRVTVRQNDVLLSDGPAFELSGRNFDKLKEKNIRTIIVTGNKELNNELETYCFMADILINALSVAQANIIYHKLDGISQREIAGILNISQPAVSKALKAANWIAVEKFMERYAQIIKKHYGSSE